MFNLNNRTTRDFIGNVILPVAIIIFIVSVLFLAITPKNAKEEPQNLVSGYGHIYKGQFLNPEYSPELVNLSPRASWLQETIPVDKSIIEPIQMLIEDAEYDGICLTVISGYRTPERQQELYDAIEDKTFVALPNESEHQTGLAVDFTACPVDKEGKRDDSIEREDLINDFETLPEYAWLVEYA